MQVSDPLNTLAHAVQSALISDLPDQVFDRRGEEVRLRPRREQVEVVLFPQTWSSTALGFDVAMAGQAMCTAYTAVVIHNRTACVYFGEGLAYTVDARDVDFRADLAARQLGDQREAEMRYGATLPRYATTTL